MGNPKLRTVHHAFLAGDPHSPSPSVLKRVPFEDHLKDSLRTLLLTRRGERPFHPLYGSTVMDLLFRPFSPSLRNELCTRIREAVAQGEPRVELTAVEVCRAPQEASRWILQLSYEIRETRKKDRMDLPI